MLFSSKILMIVTVTFYRLKVYQQNFMAQKHQMYCGQLSVTVLQDH